MCERCELRKVSVDDLFASEMSLQLPLFPSHFDNSGRLMLRCVAQVAGLYLQESERRLDRGQTKDPVPARGEDVLFLLGAFMMGLGYKRKKKMGKYVASISKIYEIFFIQGV